MINCVVLEGGREEGQHVLTWSVNLSTRCKIVNDTVLKRVCQERIKTKKTEGVMDTARKVTGA